MNVNKIYSAIINSIKFSYEFWIMMGGFCIGNLTHAMYKFQTNTDPGNHENVCWNVMVQAVCLLLCLFSAECERRLELKRKSRGEAT